MRGPAGDRGRREGDGSSLNATRPEVDNIPRVSGPILVLPDALVDQIAAGEVVERPASAVKELVENALDAGARRVRVDVEGGGITRIEVVDDGSGMSPSDARLSLERHATSKIRTFQDLTSIGTMGFRGEALPSIASVSRLVLTTSPDDSGLGTEVVAERGSPARVSPARHPKGTRVVVEDLFANVPARRKFLKSAEAELRAVVKAVTALALSRPDVAFTLGAGNRLLLDLPPAAGIASRFREVLGLAAPAPPRDVDFAFNGMTLMGAVTRPDTTFPSRAHQWFFVNGRAIRDATVAHAVALATREVLRSDRQAGFALFLACAPELCDVNVHPQKLEVRFRDPATVHTLVHRGLVAALTGGKGAVAVGGRPSKAKEEEEEGRKRERFLRNGDWVAGRVRGWRGGGSLRRRRSRGCRPLRRGHENAARRDGTRPVPLFLFTEDLLLLLPPLARFASSASIATRSSWPKERRALFSSTSTSRTSACGTRDSSGDSRRRRSPRRIS